MSDILLTGFELIAKVGEGGMGQVWKARQLSLDRIVAIKLLSERYSKDPESVKQIFQEARMAAKLKHPGIVQVYDASEEHGHFYFVMEFVDGWNVGQWIKRKKVLAVNDALVVVESVAEALDYAWRTSGLIHCDIKPENLMVEKDGAIKVADLGLSRTRDFDSSEPSDEVAGTPGYISPEQVQGEPGLDCRTDIYALGCCLYHMITGRRPFMELSDDDAIVAQVTRQIPDPREIVPSIPPAVCCLIERMLVKNRENRLVDWGAFRAELQRVQNKQMPSGPHSGEFESTLRRNPIAEEPEKVKAGLKIPKLVPVTKFRAATPARGEAVAADKRSYAMLFILLVLAAAAVALFLYVRKVEGERTAKGPDVPGIAGNPGTVASGSGNGQASGRNGMTDSGRTGWPAPVPESTLESALAEIRRTAAGFEADGALEEGVRWLEQYSGQFSPETKTARAGLATAMRQRLADREEEASWQALMKELTGALIAGKYKLALARVEAVLKDDKLRKHRGELVSVQGVLGGVVKLNDKLLETFAKDTGKIVTIRLARGEFSGQIVGVKDRMVICKSTDLAAQVNIRPEDLSMEERMARLLPLDLPELFLVRGVTAYSEKRYEDALEDLRKTGPVLAPRLARAVHDKTGRNKQDQLSADPSCMAFAAILSKAGIEPAPFDLARWRRVISEHPMTSEVAMEVERSLEEFLSAHSQSGFASGNSEMILALQKACGQAVKPAEPPPERAPEDAEAPRDMAEQ